MSRKTPYELRLPGITPDEVKAEISSHKVPYTTADRLGVRVRGDRIKAGFRDTSGTLNDRPSLTGTITADGDGSRISGSLDWFAMELGPWYLLLIGVGMSVGAIVAANQPLPGLYFAIGFGIPGLLFLAVGVLSLLFHGRTEAGRREDLTEELNDALRVLLGLPPSDSLRFARIGDDYEAWSGDSRPRAPWTGFVRPADQEDVAAVAALSAKRAGDLDVTRHQERFSQMIGSSHALLAVAYMDEGLAGYGVIEQKPAYSDDVPGGYYLTGLVVEPKYRKKGIGRALVTARLDWAWPRTDYVWYFQNSRNDVSKMTHGKLGFEEVARDITIPGVTFDWRDGTGVLYRAGRPQS